MTSQQSLFDSDSSPKLEENDLPEGIQPLADRMRPRTLDEFVGQTHLVGDGRLLRQMIESGHPSSMILWGPPGCGKTTLARLIARHAKAEFRSLSAVTAGVRDLREVVAEASSALRDGTRTILFLDEVHRFNKAQQDALLPHVEKGVIIFLGATTENPSFEVISALLSRAQVHVLEPLTFDDVRVILDRAVADEQRGVKLIVPPDERPPMVAENALRHLTESCVGDVRAALNALETAVLGVLPDDSRTRHITLHHVEEAMQRRALHYDKSGEEHFNLISAFHKSLRGSDPDGALYWMARMLEGGDDPLYIARRMVRFASEDIGNAEPRALGIANSALQAYHFLGSPEGELALAQAALFLATCPKSNATYLALDAAVSAVRKHGSLPTPIAIRNAPTPLMKAMGYGRGYLYDHDDPHGYAPQQYLPEKLEGIKFYHPVDRGYESKIQAFLEHLEQLKKEKNHK